MAAMDPSGFQMAIRVITTEGDAYPLWMTPSMSDTNDTLATVDAALGTEGDALINGLPCVESVTITMGPGLNSKLTVALAMPFDIGLKVLSSPLLRIGNKIECQIGYTKAGRFMPWISAMSAKPEVNINPEDGLSVTLNGEGGAFIALRNSRSTVYENRSYADILEAITSRTEYSGIDLLLPDSTGSEDELYRLREQTSQGNQSDWFFIQHLARTANCDAWMEPSRDRDGRQTLQIVRRSTAMEKAPRFTFLMRGNANFDTHFPILEFDSPAEGTWLPGSATSVGVGGFDVSTGGVFGLVVARGNATPVAAAPTAPPAGSLAATLAVIDSAFDIPATNESIAGTGSTTISETNIQLAIVVDPDNVGEFLHVSERDQRGAAAVATAHQTEAAIAHGGIHVTITTIGIPDLFPGETVEVHGVGLFDGAYLVQNITHTVAAGDWSMTVEILSNATQAALMSATASFSPPRVNTATAPEPNGDAEGGGNTVESVPG